MYSTVLGASPILHYGFYAKPHQVTGTSPVLHYTIPFPNTISDVENKVNPFGSSSRSVILLYTFWLPPGVA